MLTLSEIFAYDFCDIHEHVVPVLNRALIGSILRCLPAMFDHFNFPHSILHMVWFCLWKLLSSHSVPSVLLESLSLEIL